MLITPQALFTQGINRYPVRMLSILVLSGLVWHEIISCPSGSCYTRTGHASAVDQIHASVVRSCSSVDLNLNL